MDGKEVQKFEERYLTFVTTALRSCGKFTASTNLSNQHTPADILYTAGVKDLYSWHHCKRHCRFVTMSCTIPASNRWNSMWSSRSSGKSCRPSTTAISLWPRYLSRHKQQRQQPAQEEEEQQKNNNKDKNNDQDKNNNSNNNNKNKK